MSAHPSLLTVLIADTRGLLRQALDALRGEQHIIHAGVIGKRNGDEAGVLAAWAEAIPYVTRCVVC